MEPVATHELRYLGQECHSWDEVSGKVKIHNKHWSISSYDRKDLREYNIIPIAVDLENK